MDVTGMLQDATGMLQNCYKLGLFQGCYRVVTRWFQTIEVLQDVTGFL
jgi:hypothetical protein